MSCVSDVTVVDLVQSEIDGECETFNSIPDDIAHGPPKNSIDPVWDIIHRLGKPVTNRGKNCTHICLLCLKTKTWQNSLCRATNTTNAKSHLVSAHKDHKMVIQEMQHRVQRTDRYTVHVTPKPETKRPASPKPNSQDNQPIKRQKKWWKSPVTQDQISGHIARWLIRDGLAHNMITTPAFHDFLVGVTGDPNVTIPSSKTYNDILDSHYDQFTRDTTDMLKEEFKELGETPFMNVEHDLWSNSSKEQHCWCFG